MKKTLKSIISLMVVVLMVTVLVGCGTDAKVDTSEKTKFKIGCMPLNEPAVQVISKMMKDKGYEMEVVVFDGNNLPAIALKDGSIDGLMLNHLPWIKTFNELNNSNLVMVKPYMYASIFGIYSSKYDSIDQIPKNATITISNDPDNMQRSLLLLEKVGLIKLGAKKGDFFTTLDVVENTKNIKFSEVETTATASAYKDAAATISFSSVMKNAGIDASSYIADDGESVNFPTGLVVNEGNENTPWAKAIIEVTQTEEFKTKFNDIYQGAYVLFSNL
ncbi:MAG: MetQ/NlpA family ABC transporter substrate-binding protein [Firmicutes bacterium]|nr:MetQ/NlpA family ABC transporter substrate-binding protein [Bacillota bacterium]